VCCATSAVNMLIQVAKLRMLFATEKIPA